MVTQPNSKRLPKWCCVGEISSFMEETRLRCVGKCCRSCNKRCSFRCQDKDLRGDCIYRRTKTEFVMEKIMGERDNE